MIVLDENLSKRAALMLDAFDSRRQVKSILDYLDRGTSDIEILRFLSELDPKPAFVTHDQRILRNQAELLALKAANLTIVILTSNWSKLGWNESAWRLVKAWPALVAEVDNAKSPTVFELGAGSSLKVQRVGLMSDL